MKLKYLAIKNDDGKFLKDILKKKLYISNILINKLKMTNSIFVNGVPKFVTYKIKENDKILVDFENMNKEVYGNDQNMYYKDKKYLDKYQRYNYNLDILYEDEYLLIVNKPSNMAAHPSCANYEYTLSNVVATYLEKQNIFSIHIVTRLDKNTSGICIFAKNEYIQELFIRKKSEIAIKKEYIAIVDGIVENSHGIIEKNIARANDSIILREVNEKGDYAKTEYFLYKKNISKNYSILKVLLHTGRTHQIRVHMASISHVLLGDTLYADKYKVKSIDKYIKRQALHAYNISFYHPITNQYIKITCPMSNDIKKLM